MYLSSQFKISANILNMQFIDLKAQQNQLLPEGHTLREDIDNNIKKVIDHGKYILGPEVKQLEEKLASYLGVKHCVGVSSGTDALLIALMAVGINPGDEIITTPFSFFATAETIVLLGAIPVFVDIDPTTYNLDPLKIEYAISRKTKAIVPVSLYGQPANFKEINTIAKRHNLAVIEDGAQSFGSTHHNKKSGNLSTIGTTSFFPSKPLGGYGDGGACFTNDDNFARKMREISLHGQIKRYDHLNIGINGRLDTLQAAILLSKIKVFDKEIILRQKIAKRYDDIFKDNPLIVTPHISDYNTSVYAQYTIQVNKRDEIIDFLNTKSIPSAVHYPILLSDQDALKAKSKRNPFKKIFSKKKFKSYKLMNASSICKNVLSLPMHPLLSEVDQDYIIEQVLNYTKKLNNI